MKFKPLITEQDMVFYKGYVIEQTLTKYIIYPLNSNQLYSGPLHTTQSVLESKQYIDSIGVK